MKSFRIWADNDKKVEAIWLGYLLKLIGCKVWIGNYLKDVFQTRDCEHLYTDIILFETIDFNICCSLSAINPFDHIIVSGNQYVSTPTIAYNWTILPELKIINPNTLKYFIKTIYPRYLHYIEDEENSIIDITEIYIKNNSQLAKAMYTIEELFIGKIPSYYSNYISNEVLREAVDYIKICYNSLIEKINYNSSYIDYVVLFYLKTLINDGNQKLGKEKEFSDDSLIHNINYLDNLSQGREKDLGILLKLKIAPYTSESIHLLNEVKETLSSINLAPEYIDQIYGEIGKIYRSTIKESELAIKFLSNVNENNIENYHNIYILGILYQIQASTYDKRHSYENYEYANQKYRQVISMLKPIGISNMTPKEFIYYISAIVKFSKLQLQFGNISELSYQEELNNLKVLCSKYFDNSLLNILFPQDELNKNLTNEGIKKYIKEITNFK